MPADDVNFAVSSAVKDTTKECIEVFNSFPLPQSDNSKPVLSSNTPIVFSIHSLPVLCSVLYVSCMCACVNGPSVSRLVSLCTVSFLNHVVNKMAAIFVAGGSNLIWTKTSCKYVSDSLCFSTYTVNSPLYHILLQKKPIDSLLYVHWDLLTCLRLCLGMPQYRCL